MEKNQEKIKACVKENPAVAKEVLSIMEKYDDFAKKVDDYNEKDMSTEDAKYYLDVTNRINKKMLDLYN